MEDTSQKKVVHPVAEYGAIIGSAFIQALGSGKEEEFLEQFNPLE